MTRLPFSLFIISIMVMVSACGSEPSRVVVTIAPTQIGAGAPIYTATASFTPSATPTVTLSPTVTQTPTATSTLTLTPTASFTPTSTNTPTSTPTATASSTATPQLVPPTQINLDGAPPSAMILPADTTVNTGWSCGDFPCEDDIEGFLERISVPQGFEVSYTGQVDGQVQQIAQGNDGRLYATVLENGTQIGAVYVLLDDGTSERYSETIISPNGLAFQPASDVLYVSGRTSLETGGALYRVDENNTDIVIDDLPCCFQMIGNQPNGLAFGADGLLYLGIGSVTDRAESPNPARQPFAVLSDFEASILQINPHTGDVTSYASGLRNPFDIAFDSIWQLYASDIGLVTGEGDRILEVNQSQHYGFPFYRTRGCADCPARPATLDVSPDLLTLPDFTIPRGLTVYTGTQFPQNMQDTLFVTFWNGTDWGQRVIWIDPDDPRLTSEEYHPQPFMTGLIRPTDVIVAHDGSLLVADFIYGHIWRVSYTGAGFVVPETTSSDGFLIPTNTPRP